MHFQEDKTIQLGKKLKCPNSPKEAHTLCMECATFSVKLAHCAQNVRLYTCKPAHNARNARLFTGKDAHFHE
jgi:hypothetical protein